MKSRRGGKLAVDAKTVEFLSYVEPTMLERMKACIDYYGYASRAEWCREAYEGLLARHEAGIAKANQRAAARDAKTA